MVGLWSIQNQFIKVQLSPGVLLYIIKLQGFGKVAQSRHWILPNSSLRYPCRIVPALRQKVHCSPKKGTIIFKKKIIKSTLSQKAIIFVSKFWILSKIVIIFGSTLGLYWMTTFSNFNLFINRLQCYLMLLI